MAILVGWHIRTCTLLASRSVRVKQILCVELFARQQATFYAGLAFVAGDGRSGS